MKTVMNKCRAVPYSQLADSLGRSIASVTNMARKLGVARKIKAISSTELIKLNEEGYSDSEIASMMGKDRATVRNRRRALGLPSRWFGKRHREKLRQNAKELLKTGVMIQINRCRRMAAERFARKSGWPEDVSARQVQVLNVLAAIGVPATKEEIAVVMDTSVHNLNIHCLTPLVNRSLISFVKVPRAGGGRLNKYTLGVNALAILEERSCQEAK